MFVDHLFMPDLNKKFSGKVSGNHAPPCYTFGKKLQEQYEFLTRSPRHCNDECEILTINNNGLEVGFLRAGKSDGINVINSFYLWPEQRGCGFFVKYMGELCGGIIPFVLRPLPHILFTDEGTEITNLNEYSSSTKANDDHSNIQRITERYISLGLKRASVTGLTKPFLTNYGPNDHKRVIIQQ